MYRTTIVALFAVCAALSVGCAISSEPEPTPEPQKVGEVEKPAAPEGTVTTQMISKGDGMTCTVHRGVTTCCDKTACVSF